MSVPEDPEVVLEEAEVEVPEVAEKPKKKFSRPHFKVDKKKIAAAALSLLLLFLLVLSHAPESTQPSLPSQPTSQTSSLSCTPANEGQRHPQNPALVCRRENGAYGWRIVPPEVSSQPIAPPIPTTAPTIALPPPVIPPSAELVITEEQLARMIQPYSWQVRLLNVDQAGVGTVQVEQTGAQVEVSLSSPGVRIGDQGVSVVDQYGQYDLSWGPVNLSSTFKPTPTLFPREGVTEDELVAIIRRLGSEVAAVKILAVNETGFRTCQITPFEVFGTGLVYLKTNQSKGAVGIVWWDAEKQKYVLRWG